MRCAGRFLHIRRGLGGIRIRYVLYRLFVQGFKYRQDLALHSAFEYPSSTRPAKAKPRRSTSVTVWPVFDVAALPTQVARCGLRSVAGMLRSMFSYFADHVSRL